MFPLLQCLPLKEPMYTFQNHKMLIFLIGHIFKKFNTLSASVNRIRNGEKILLPDDGNDEVSEMAHQINEMIVALEKLNKENVNRELIVKNTEIKESEFTLKSGSGSFHVGGLLGYGYGANFDNITLNNNQLNKIKLLCNLFNYETSVIDELMK